MRTLSEPTRLPSCSALFAALLVVSLPVRAGVLDAAPADPLALRLPADAAVLGGTTAVVLLTSVLHLAPAQCTWCSAPPGIDASIHDALTSALFSRRTADTLSNVWVVGVAPVAAISAALLATGPQASDGAGLRATVIVLESTTTALALVQSLKLVAARERPFVHYGHATSGATDAEGTVYDGTAADSHLGFPSGHTATAAALGVSAAMIATLDHSAAAPWLWGAASALTLGAGTLRIIAEKHYFTDVLAGAAIGTACGVAIPLLHRRGSLLGDPAPPAATLQISVAPARASPAVMLSGLF